MMKIAIAGATGRMGRMLIETVLNSEDAQLVGALEHSSCPQLGEDPFRVDGGLGAAQADETDCRGTAGGEGGQG